MDFFKILNIAGTILAWLIVLAVVYALYPHFHKLLNAIQMIHDFVK